MNPLEIAVNRLVDLRAEVAELENFIRVYYKLMPEEKLAAKVANGSLRLTPSEPVDKPVDNVSVRSVAAPLKRRKRTTDVLVDEMDHLINEIRKPLDRSDIVDLLERRGFTLPETDKPRYVGTILWRNRDRFRNLPGHGYWLRRLPYAPANYDPVTDTEVERILDEAPTSVNGHEALTRAEQAEMLRLREQIEGASVLYNQDEGSSISDASYDTMKRRLLELELK